MIEQMVIAAGGVGKRMSNEVNIHHSKVLIFYNGVPIVQYLIKWAKEAGIKNFFISVNRKNKKWLEWIVKEVDVKCTLSLTGRTLAHVPGLFREELDERFLFACGHQPIPSEHIRKMIEMAERYDSVITAYDNIQNKTTSKKRTIVLENGDFKLVDLNVERVPENHIYLRNPYILTRQMIEQIEEDKFKYNPGFYIFKLWESGGGVGIIRATMPVEFDYDSEFERTKDWIKRYLKKRDVIG